MASSNAVFKTKRLGAVCLIGDNAVANQTDHLAGEMAGLEIALKCQTVIRHKA